MLRFPFCSTDALMLITIKLSAAEVQREGGGSQHSFPHKYLSLHRNDELNEDYLSFV